MKIEIYEYNSRKDPIRVKHYRKFSYLKQISDDEMNYISQNIWVKRHLYEKILKDDEDLDFYINFIYDLYNGVVEKVLIYRHNLSRSRFLKSVINAYIISKTLIECWEQEHDKKNPYRYLSIPLNKETQSFYGAYCKLLQSIVIYNITPREDLRKGQIKRALSLLRFENKDNDEYIERHKLYIYYLYRLFLEPKSHIEDYHIEFINTYFNKPEDHIIKHLFLFKYYYKNNMWARFNDIESFYRLSIYRKDFSAYDAGYITLLYLMTLSYDRTIGGITYSAYMTFINKAYLEKLLYLTKKRILLYTNSHTRYRESLSNLNKVVNTLVGVYKIEKLYPFIFLNFVMVKMLSRLNVLNKPTVAVFLSNTINDEKYKKMSNNEKNIILNFIEIFRCYYYFIQPKKSKINTKINKHFDKLNNTLVTHLTPVINLKMIKKLYEYYILNVEHKLKD